MGISEVDLAYIIALGELPRRVCDLGDQTLFCNDEAAFDRLGLNAPRCGKARDFWKALGAEYVALDVVGDVERFDLNVDRVPANWQPFDLVMNCGTTEHIIGQANAFQVIHELTRAGGVMYHQLPVGGYAGHGFFVYSLKFFAALADANSYEVLAAHVDVASSNASNVERPMGSLAPHLAKLLTIPDAGARIALRKTSAAPFVLPMDVPPSLYQRALGKFKRIVGLH